MQRRAFFYWLLAGALVNFSGAAKPAYSGSLGADRRLYCRAMSEIRGLFSNVDDAREIGRSYLTLHPEKANLHLLLNEIGLFSEYANNSVSKHVNHLRQTDFLNRNTIFLNGWYLARSEVYLCAIIALSDQT